MDNSGKSGRLTQALLPAAFLAVIFSVGLVQTATDIRAWRAPQYLDVLRHVPTRDYLRQFESSLEKASWVQQKVRPFMQSLRFAALGSLGKDIMTGRDGWLFYKPGVQYLMEPWPPRGIAARTGNPLATPSGESAASDALSAIVSFRDQLAARGIRLMVVPVPEKASVHPEMLAARVGNRGRGMSTHTTDLMDELRAAGVEVIDLFEAFAASLDGRGDAPVPDFLYLARDTHWSPDGMQLASDTVARRLLELAWVEPGNAEYGLKPLAVERFGDIVRMAEVPGIERAMPPELATCAQVVARDGTTPYSDAADADVLVIGDSFLRIYQNDDPGSAGFIAHLARGLGMPVASIVNDGGATTLVRQVIARQPAWLRGKRVVVWEFVERDIRFGEQGWAEIKLR